MPVGAGFIPARIGENKKMTEHKKLQPEIRFAGFTDDWEQRKAEDVFISISEKNHETFPVLSATQDKGMISRNDVGIDIKYDVNSLKTYKLVRKDQFVIHLRSFQGGFAHSAIDGITSPAYTILDFKDKRIHSPLFWREIFKSDFFIKRLESVIYGIRDGRSINYDEFLKLNFNYPSFEEQTQIGNFFKQLDDTIALHQRTLEKYQKLKVSYLEKMFPKGNERYPELRFPNSTDAWEQRKLGECFNERTERSSIGELISVTMNSGVIKASDLDRKDNSSKDKSNYKKVEIGDIAYNSMRMWQGSSGESTFRGILSPAYTVLIPNKDISSTFFSYYFKLERMLEIFKVNSQGLTSDTWNLKYPTIAKIVVSVPTLKEQIQIGNFFKQLDDTIALHQREVEKYKKIKQSYLEKMFI